MANIKVFTKPVKTNTYDAGLANSVHFELEVNGVGYELNNGYGILFPKADIREDNTIDPRGAKNPVIKKANDGYVILCDYVDETGNDMAPGMKYAWETYDFASYEEIGLVRNSAEGLKDANSCMGIPDELVNVIEKKWMPPYGCASQNHRHFSYPLVKGFADPVIFTWNNKWYFLATNDINGNIGIFMREAESVDGLFEDGYRLSVILDYDEDKEFIQTFWAPEWHIIGGVPYILFAVGGKKWAPQSHMMKYKGNGDIMSPDSWEMPVRVRKTDGSFLADVNNPDKGITLDMTYLKTKRASYVIWSERYHIGTSLDSGSMLYIASVDEKNPTILTSDKVLLSRPLHGWENVAGTINNEGPYCMIRGEKVLLSYSGGDACGHYYAVGLLTANTNEDLLNPSNWTKSQTPFFSAYTIKGIDGPGHSSFFKDENGVDMIAFHGQDNGRQSGIYQLDFTEDDMPILI